MSLPRFRSCSFKLWLACGALVGGTGGVLAQDPPLLPPRDPIDTPLPKGRPQAIYFPPFPPALERPAPDGPIDRSEGATNSAAPPALAPYVSEIFYPPLGARLWRGTLTSKLRGEIARYRSEKDTLLVELRAELVRQESAPPATRLAALEALARRQATRLADSEAKAEQLRRQLTQLDHGWDDLREWHLNGSAGIEVRRPGAKYPTIVKRGFSPAEIAEVMRGAAFYFPSLQTPQRRLLREIALELTLAGEDFAEAATAQPHLFFSPEMARIVVPENLPPGAAEKLTAFQAQKAKLKKRLYDLITTEDRPGLNLMRGGHLRAFVERQAADLATLEMLAEDFRRALPPVRRQAPVRPALSADLFTRLAELQRTLAALQEETLAAINPIVTRAEGLRVSHDFTSAGLVHTVTDGAETREDTKRVRSPRAVVQRIEAIERELDAVAADYGRRYADLVNAANALKATIGPAVRATRADEVEAVWTAANQAVAIEASADAYHEYRVAVFEPGLSLAQRRLLFDGAIDQMGLPLPSGALQPTQRDAGGTVASDIPPPRGGPGGL